MKLTQYKEQDNFKKSLKIIMSILCAIVLLMSARCSQSHEPDLIPEGRSGAEGRNSFCNINSDGELVVKVRNQTNNNITISTETTVTFLTNNGPVQITQVTPPMPGGSSNTHTFPIPAGCFNSDCSFTIQVDSGNVLDESHGEAPDNHETNNLVEGICIG